MKIRHLLCSLLLSLAVAPLHAGVPVYLDENKPLEDRVEDALSQMTLEEKVAMCHGQGKFSSKGVPRLGIPELWMSDGPHGVRAEVSWKSWSPAGWTNDFCTAFPALTCLAATFNPEMSALYGQVLGEESRYRGKDVILGPGVNIYRTPLNGRNFEYMGEDPYLASEMVVPYIRNVQKNGVAACVKHYALNNQELWRSGIEVGLSKRALHEIYLPAFKAAVERGKVWSLMSAYNKYLGDYCSENETLLNKILKKDWKFDGAVISDWGATHNTVPAAKGGLDIEMGTSEDPAKNHLGTPFLNALKEGKVSEDVLNDKVRRNLKLIFRTAMNTKKPWGSFATQEHADAGRKIAEEGIVLLKNDDGILPLKPDKVKTLAVIGENATKKMTLGGGSSELKVWKEVSPLDGIRDRYGKGTKVEHAPGYTSDGKAKNRQQLFDEAVKMASEADAVVFVGGLNKNARQDSEGDDRKEYGLPYGQDELIEALAKTNKNLVVVLISGNAVEMPWASDAKGIVQGWYLGSEAGNALASVLSGDVNPSGKLPFTFPVKLEDNGAHSFGEESYPGVNKAQQYKEDILVGYRWHDTKNIKPRFAFGHGLSYTTFEINDLKAPSKGRIGEPVKVTCTVRNTGKLPGAEVVQLYVSDPESSVSRPAKELKGFSKVFLKPGESREVVFELAPEAFAFFDEKADAWKTEAGEFRILVGNASDNITKQASIRMEP